MYDDVCFERSHSQGIGILTGLAISIVASQHRSGPCPPVAISICHRDATHIEACNSSIDHCAWMTPGSSPLRVARFVEQSFHSLNQSSTTKDITSNSGVGWDVKGYQPQSIQVMVSVYYVSFVRPSAKSLGCIAGLIPCGALVTSSCYYWAESSSGYSTIGDLSHKMARVVA